MARSTDASIALLPIHPEFASESLSRAKRVEFRRRGFARDVSHVVIYATAPEMRIVGWFRVAGIEKASPSMVWDRHVTGTTSVPQSFMYLSAERARRAGIDC